MTDNQKEFYANAVNISISPYDVNLNFRLQDAEKTEEDVIITVSSQYNVRMSPQHAKSLAALLVEHIRKYEENFNVVLPIPQDIKKTWERNVK